MFSKTEKKPKPPYLTASIKEAIEKGNLAEVEGWLNYNKDLINEKSFSLEFDGSMTPLDLAVKKGNVDIAKFLARNGATVSKKFLKSINPSPEMLQIIQNVQFTKQGYPPSKPGSPFSSFYSLHEVISFTWDGEHLDLLSRFIDYDPNSVNAKDRNSTTALEHAIWHGHPIAVKILLENDAKADEKVFAYAAYAGFKVENNIQKLDILAKHGYAKNLHICTQALLETVDHYKGKDKFPVFEHILKTYPIDWNYTDVNNNRNLSLNEIVLAHSLTAFDLLCQYGKEKVTDKLFANGNTLMQQIAEGKIELKNQSELLKILFKHNANPTIRHYTTKATAYQIARLSNRHDIAEAIKTYTKELYRGKMNLGDTIEEQDLQVHEVLHPKQKQPQPIAEFNIDKQFFIQSKDLVLDKMLGQGGFGKVYAAKWFQIQVAVKVLKGDFTATTIEVFKKEANLFHKLRHKNIVQMYGICNEPGNYAIIMEYMEKGSLFQILHSSEKLDWSVRINICVDIANGMNYLHSNNIIHRDLKSLNVLLSTHMEAKICDFGLADIKQESSLTCTSANQAVGTIPWMAPELFTKNPEFSLKSDIYSLTMIFWEIATRKIPWEKTPVGALIGLLLTDQHEDLPPPDTPKSIASLIQFGWLRNPNERPTIEEVVHHLQSNSVFTR